MVRTTPASFAKMLVLGGCVCTLLAAISLEAGLVSAAEQPAQETGLERPKRVPMVGAQMVPALTTPAGTSSPVEKATDAHVRVTPPTMMSQNPDEPIRPPQPSVPAAPAVAQTAPAGAPAPVATPKANPSTPEDFRPPASHRDGEPLFLDYKDQDLTFVIKSIGAVIGRNFNVDPALGTQKVTIISHAPVPVEILYEVLESIVASKNGRMIDDIEGNLINVVMMDKGKDKVALSTDRHKWPEGYDRLSTHIVGVEYADVTELANIITSLGSDGAMANAYGVTNTLILTDTADGVKNMLKFLNEIDVPGFEEEIRIFTLTHARAEVIAVQILDVLLGEEPGAPGAAPGPIRQPVVRPLRGAVPAQKSQTIIGRRPETLRIVPDERLSSLIVIASSDMMERVRELIEKLDTPALIETNNMHVYHLLNADAETLETALSPFFRTATPRQQSTGQQGRGATPGGDGGGGAQQASVQPFEKEVALARYDEANALLIMASPQDYRLIEAFIAELDVPPRQVHVSATIAKVTISDTHTLSVEAAGLTANDAFTLNNVVDIANVLGGDVLGTAQAGELVFGVLDGTTTIIQPDGAGGLVQQEVPNVPILLSALEFLTALDVLSTPNLTTVDNEESLITIGQNVPMVQGSQSSLNQGGVGASVYNRIDREDIGIKMTVEPQINEGDYVLLALNVEVSALASAQNSVGDANTLGPTLDKTEIENIVSIKDGSTGIIGGLISESVTRSRWQTPLVGDLPLLGWLFRTKSETRLKQNLIVLVTPHIIRDGTDIERLTEFKTDEVSKANADVIFERGYIRKVRKKHHLRNRARPAQDAIDRMRQEDEGFSRGAVER